LVLIETVPFTWP